MKNKRESGLVQTIEIESQEIPRIGDFIKIRGVSFPQCKGISGEVHSVKVYAVHRNIRMVENNNEHPKRKYVPEPTVVRALIKKSYIV